jgi:hypothetical protein
LTAAASGIRAGVKEHLLSPSDRAALQSLIPLASALGAGTIFALFLGGRRRAGFAVFEVFAIVAVLVAVGSTAYFCIALLHRNEAISDSDLTHVASPLLVAAFLLVFISISSRIPGSLERALVVGPLVLGAAIVAYGVTADSTWNTDSGHASVVALLVLLIGAVVGFATTWFDRMDLARGRRAGYERVARLTAAGYAAERRPLALGLPEEGGDAAEPVGCWRRRDRLYLDATSLRGLRETANGCWGDYAAGEALAPQGPAMLVGVKLGWGIRVPRWAEVTTATGAERAAHRLRPNGEGLFEVTGLGLV